MMDIYFYSLTNTRQDLTHAQRRWRQPSNCHPPPANIMSSHNEHYVKIVH